LADVYDALTTQRYYKEAFSHAKSRTIILEGRAKHFDPAVVEAFLVVEDQFTAIRDLSTLEELTNLRVDKSKS
jgi:response regulator RpfG family c-di-GMP phosphodiesterase